MIPHKLTIKNFLSYGPETQTIEFAPHRLICLSGKNGHGKSALLDAMTWALWGVARKTLSSVKPDEGLLHLGQTQMFVMLDFELNGTMYRIRREFLNTYGKPYANLDFGILDVATDTFSPLTDKTIRKTQEKIEQVLRLSYNAFVNSAFLRQGHSNEFSKKSPKERKEILANILGLDQYETLRKLAGEKTKSAQNQLATLQAFQEKLDTELAKKETIVAASLELEKKVKALTEQEQTVHNKSIELDTHEKKIAQQQKQCEMLEFELKKQQESEESQLVILKEIVSAWRTIHKKILLLPNQEALEAQKKQLLSSLQEHQQKFQQTLELKEKYLSTKEKNQHIAEAIQKEHQKTTHEALVTLDRMRTQSQVQEQSLKSTQAKKELIAKELQELQQKLITFQSKLKQGKKVEEAREAISVQFEKRKAAYQQFITLANQMSNELKGISNKEALVHNDQDPSCPLCEQNLSASRRKFLKAKFSKDQHFIEHQLKRLTNIIKKLKEILVEQHKQLEVVKKETEELRAIEIKAQECEKQVTKLNIESDLLTKEVEKIHTQQEQHLKALTAHELVCKKVESETQTIVASHPQYQEAQKQLDAIITAGKSIAYNQKQHQETQATLQAIELQLSSCAALQAESIAQNQRKQEISMLIQSLKKQRREKKELLSKLDEFKQIAQEIKDSAQKRKEITEQTGQLVAAKELLLKEQGSLIEQQKKLVQFETEHKEQQEQIKKLHQTIFDYQTIATATGKDGIQALLIEEAIPEIEHEANYLLSRLTNNQGHIIIESLRDLKKGGTKETLDIKISDPAGIRPYEMFSGGEAFRIDFALRIAISKLLARRAGTALQTLIIDEGFGSLDDEGLSNVMDCIHKIQDDFSLIVIVSHLNTMKDQFPVHFVVEKRAQASKVNVIELG